MSLDLLTIFGAGLLTFVAPCVLPLVPIFLAALVGGDVVELRQVSRGRLVRRASLFALGFLVVFTAMGLAASSLGAFFHDHRAALQLVGAGLVLAFALRFLGVLKLTWLDRIARLDDSKLKTRFGSVNAVLMGVVFAAGWSPCVGPVLGSVLTYTASSTASPWTGALYLTTYGLGLAAPLILVAAFVEPGLRAMRRLKPHLPRFEKATGVVLLGVAGFLVHGAAEGWSAPALASGDASAGASVATTPANEPVSATAAPQVVELYAAGCPICQRMAPLVDQLRDACRERGLNVTQIDVSLPENRHLARRHRIRGVPTLLFVDAEGEEVARLVGEQTEATLRQAMTALDGGTCAGLGPLPSPAIEEAASESCSMSSTPAASEEEEAELPVAGSCSTSW